MIHLTSFKKIAETGIFSTRSDFFRLTPTILMKSKAVKVVFDRRKEAAKKGYGYVDVVVNLGKKGHSCISPWQYNHVIQRS